MPVAASLAAQVLPRCFHGNVRLIQVDNHDHTALGFYDSSWNKLDLRHPAARGDSRPIAEPSNLSEMIQVAEKLAHGIDFVRVGLFNARGRIYFGEMTFTPDAGLYTFEPDEWDRVIEGWW